MTKIEDKYFLRVEYLRCLFKDPDFVERANRLPKFDMNSEDVVSKYIKLAVDYDVVVDDVLSFLINGSEVYDDKLYCAVLFDSVTGNAHVIVDKQATKEEYKAVWEQIIEARESMGIMPTKRKASYNTQLIYAITRARKKYTYPEIFELYRNGDLQLYQGYNKQYSDKHSLEAFHHKYDPTT